MRAAQTSDLAASERMALLGKLQKVPDGIFSACDAVYLSKTASRATSNSQTLSRFCQVFERVVLSGNLTNLIESGTGLSPRSGDIRSQLGKYRFMLILESSIQLVIARATHKSKVYGYHSEFAPFGKRCD